MNSTDFCEYLNLESNLIFIGKEYHGHSIIEFQVNTIDYDEGELFIDFHCKYLKSIKINDIDMSVEEYFQNQRIRILKDSINAGRNKVELFFVNSYRYTGTGLHKFQDPADHGEYLYTQFEPFHAHRAIPCFDQPDIKGSMTLATVVPSDHVSLSNSHEESDFTNTENPDGCRRFFEENEIGRAHV